MATGWRVEGSELVNWTVVDVQVSMVSGLAIGRFLLIEENRSKNIFLLVLESAV